MILQEVSNPSLTKKRRSRKSLAARRRQQKKTRKRSASSMANRRIWYSNNVIKSPVVPVVAPVTPAINPVNLEIVKKEEATNASFSRLLGYGLIGGAAYAVLRKS